MFTCVYMYVCTHNLQSNSYSYCISWCKYRKAFCYGVSVPEMLTIHKLFVSCCFCCGSCNFACSTSYCSLSDIVCPSRPPDSQLIYPFDFQSVSQSVSQRERDRQAVSQAVYPLHVSIHMLSL